MQKWWTNIQKVKKSVKFIYNKFNNKTWPQFFLPLMSVLRKFFEIYIKLKSFFTWSVLQSLRELRVVLVGVVVLIFLKLAKLGEAGFCSGTYQISSLCKLVLTSWNKGPFCEKTLKHKMRKRWENIPPKRLPILKKRREEMLCEFWREGISFRMKNRTEKLFFRTEFHFLHFPPNFFRQIISFLPAIANFFARKNGSTFSPSMQKKSSSKYPGFSSKMHFFECLFCLGRYSKIGFGRYFPPTSGSGLSMESANSKKWRLSHRNIGLKNWTFKRQQESFDNTSHADFQCGNFCSRNAEKLHS